jgi:hypothetical protein
MRRLGFVLLAVTGCIDGPDEANEIAAAEVPGDAAAEEPADAAIAEPAGHVEHEIDPLGTRCGAPAGPALAAEWILGESGIPVALAVGPNDAAGTLSVEFHVLDGATVEEVVTERATRGGREVFELPARVLEDAAEFAADHRVPFGRVSALVIARDGSGRAIGAGDAPAIHFKKDEAGALAGFSPREAAMAPELTNAYPEVVAVEGIEPANTYVRVFTSNPGE